MKKKTSVSKKVLILRTCASDMTSYNGFRWPESGHVECPDWKATEECGNGLHGLLWGCGDGGLLNWSHDARWLVAEVEESELINLGGKMKFPHAVVVHCGTQQSATEYIRSNGAADKPVVGAIVNAAGDGGTATAGYGGTATAGHRGTATAGYGGTATAGDGGTLCVKYWDGKRYRRCIAYVGENGIKPNVRYRVGNGAMVEVKGDE